MKTIVHAHIQTTCVCVTMMYWEKACCFCEKEKDPKVS